MSNTINIRARRTRRSPRVEATPTPEPVVTSTPLGGSYYANLNPATLQDYWNSSSISEPTGLLEAARRFGDTETYESFGGRETEYRRMLDQAMREELVRQSRIYTAGNMDALRPTLDQAQRAWDNINRSAASLATPQETVYQAEVQVAPNTIPLETIHRGLVDDIMRSIPYEELKKLFPIERISSEALSGNFIRYRAKFKTIKRRRNGN